MTLAAKNKCNGKITRRLFSQKTQVILYGTSKG